MNTAAQMRTAAKWWADKLRCPSFNMGDDSITGMLAATISARTNPDPGEQAAQAFEDALFVEILAAETEGRYYDLSVDYHPSSTLYNALKSAGVPATMGRLPIKTWMKFENGKVFVAEGYGAHLEEVPLVELEAEAV